MFVGWRLVHIAARQTTGGLYINTIILKYISNPTEYVKGHKRADHRFDKSKKKKWRFPNRCYNNISG
jgi:TfoX/Sxy family transcriptional regulator of competence genes